MKLDRKHRVNRVGAVATAVNLLLGPVSKWMVSN